MLYILIVGCLHALYVINNTTIDTNYLMYCTVYTNKIYFFVHLKINFLVSIFFYWTRLYVLTAFPRRLFLEARLGFETVYTLVKIASIRSRCDVDPHLFFADPEHLFFSMLPNNKISVTVKLGLIWVIGTVGTPHR